MSNFNSSTNRLENTNKNIGKSDDLTFSNQEVPQQNFSATSPMDNSSLGLGVIGKTRHNMSMDYTDCNLLEFGYVCGLLKIGKSTLYGLVNSKSIKAVKLLGRTLFRESDVRDFIANLPEYEGGSNGF